MEEWTGVLKVWTERSDVSNGLWPLQYDQVIHKC